MCSCSVWLPTVVWLPTSTMLETASGKPVSALRTPYAPQGSASSTGFIDTLLKWFWYNQT